MYLPPEHPIIVIWNKSNQNGRRICKTNSVRMVWTIYSYYLKWGLLRKCNRLPECWSDWCMDPRPTGRKSPIFNHWSERVEGIELKRKTIAKNHFKKAFWIETSGMDILRISNQPEPFQYQRAKESWIEYLTLNPPWLPVTTCQHRTSKKRSHNEQFGKT